MLHGWLVNTLGGLQGFVYKLDMHAREHGRKGSTGGSQPSFLLHSQPILSSESTYEVFFSYDDTTY